MEEREEGGEGGEGEAIITFITNGIFEFVCVYVF